MVARRLSSITHADRIVVLTDGHIVEEGRHVDLFALGGVLGALAAAGPATAARRSLMADR
jgi:ABC-type transport system involved in Fe-S cluster assembly fused permease/ATPase subunit